MLTKPTLNPYERFPVVPQPTCINRAWHQVVVLAHKQGSELVPILIKIQNLQLRYLENRDTFDKAWNWVDTYLQIEYKQSKPALYCMLR